MSDSADATSGLPDAAASAHSTVAAPVETDPAAPAVCALTGLPYSAESISTQRLLLRPLHEADLDDVTGYRSREDVTRYLLWEARDHDQAAAHHEKRRAMTWLASDGDGLTFAAELPDPAGGHGRVIGDVSVLVKCASDAQIEVGWVFHPAVHGRGYATEAALAVLSLCFETLGAHRVSAEMDPRNDASARLCEHIGMRQEAHLREDVVIKGEWGDTLIYGMLASEWAARV